MLQQLLNALAGKATQPQAVEVLELVQPRIAPPVQPKAKTYPRSVCTSLKDLCEL